jgi:hypothetical protein
MPKFVIEREWPGASKLSESELRGVSLKSLEARRKLGPEIQWLASYVTDDKIYCIYFAATKPRTPLPGRKPPRPESIPSVPQYSRRACAPPHNVETGLSLERSKTAGC